MRLTFVFIFSIFFSCMAVAPEVSKKSMFFSEAYDHGYIVFLVRHYGADEHTALMYADAICRYTKKYNLPEANGVSAMRLVGRQVLRESYFNYTLKNSIGACGPCQIMPIPEHVALMKKTEQYERTVPVIQQFFWIYNSIELLCILMSYYYRHFGSYEIALIAYWCGPNSEQLRKYIGYQFDFQSTEYYKYIMLDGYVERIDMGY